MIPRDGKPIIDVFAGNRNTLSRLDYSRSVGAACISRVHAGGLGVAVDATWPCAFKWGQPCILNNRDW